MPNFPNRCQHLKVNGTQCGSPALRRNRFCYFHKLHHEERIELNLDRLKNARRRRATIDLPVLEDANSIQVSLMQIMRLIIAGQIDGKTAGLLLYALQTASSNLPRLRFDPFKHDVVLDPKTVNETPLSGHIWEDSDFESDEEEDDDPALRVQALEEAQRKARKKIELDRRAEAEANRLATIGARPREAQARTQARPEKIATKDAPAAVVTLAGRAVPPPAPTPPPPGKRPPAHVSLDEVRKKVTAQIRKELPAIAAAVANREKRHRENGNSAG